MTVISTVEELKATQPVAGLVRLGSRIATTACPENYGTENYGS